MDNVFTLEALFAKKGDSLLLHYGPWDDPKLILVDGGPRGVYRKFLRPRLRELREELEVPQDQSLPLRMVMVSHIDDDHIAGILDLFKEAAVAKERHRPVPYAIGTLWHNSFDDILGNAGNAVVSRMAATVASRDPGGLAVPKMKRESRAVVSSTAQGRNLRNAAARLQVETNKHFEGLVMSPAKKISLGHGLKMTVVGPDKDRVIEFQQRWDKDLKKILKKGGRERSGSGLRGQVSLQSGQHLRVGRDEAQEDSLDRRRARGLRDRGPGKGEASAQDEALPRGYPQGSPPRQRPQRGRHLF